MPVTKPGPYVCEHCGANLNIRKQFAQEKDEEYVLTCPNCKGFLGSFNTRKNIVFIATCKTSHL